MTQRIVPIPWGETRYLEDRPENWARAELHFPGVTAAFDRCRDGSRFLIHIQLPHITIEDARCWHDHHKVPGCRCHTWNGKTWERWIK